MYADIITGTGVFFILLAFFAGTFKILNNQGKLYFILNILGGGLACWGSVLLNSIPFTLLEGTWSIVAVIGLTRNFAGSKNDK